MQAMTNFEFYCVYANLFIFLENLYYKYIDFFYDVASLILLHFALLHAP